MTVGVLWFPLFRFTVHGAVWERLGALPTDFLCSIAAVIVVHLRRPLMPDVAKEVVAPMEYARQARQG